MDGGVSSLLDAYRSGKLSRRTFVQQGVALGARSRRSASGCMSPTGRTRPRTEEWRR